MKYIILTMLAVLANALSFFILVIAINSVGVQGLTDLMQSDGEQSQFYASCLFVFIISAILIGIMWHKAKVLTPKH